jgi:hypothetical protein
LALPIALARTTFLVVPTEAGLWRGIANPPGIGRLALAAAVAALAAWFAHRLPRRACYPLLAGLLAAAPLVPIATGHAVLLLAFGPPLMRIVLCAAVAAALSRIRPSWTDPSPRTCAVLAFAFYAIVGLYLPGPAGPQGDEPHYLTMAESLKTDGDLDLHDELETRAYAPFYAGTLAPHTSPASPPGRDYPIHTPGLPALLLPAYAAFGYTGARLFMSALAACLVGLVARLARGVARPSVAAAALAVTPPLAFYAQSLYPEVPVAVAAALFLVAARERPWSGWHTSALLAATAVPWLHPKYLPLAVLGLAFSVWQASRLQRALAFAGLASSTAALLLFMHALYGRASLSAAYGSGFHDDVTPWRALWGAPALLLDRQFGLFAVAPVFLLVIPGVGALLRRAPTEALRALALAAAAFGVNASFSMWWGGTCPPARFLVPCLPALALCTAAAAAARPGLAAALVGAGLGIVAVACEAPRALHNRADGESALLRVLARPLDLDALLPSFVIEERVALLLGLSLLGVFALLWLRGARGLLVGSLAYGALIAGTRPHPLLNAREATLALLDGYDDRDMRPVSGAVPLESLRVALDLPEAPWELGADDVRRSRRIDLAPGRYRLEIGGQILEARPTAHVVRLDLVSEESRLTRLYLEDGKPLPEAVLDLPEGARRLVLEATGIQGRGRIDTAVIAPVSLLGRRERARR